MRDVQGILQTKGRLLLFLIAHMSFTIQVTGDYFQHDEAMTPVSRYGVTI